jgi:ABC-type sulfate transport system substrate-binding protein
LIPARAAALHSTQQGTGDVLITWENEAYLTLDRAGRRQVPDRLPLAVDQGRAASRCRPRQCREERPEQVAEPKPISSISTSPLVSASSRSTISAPNDPAAADPEDLKRFQPVEMVTIDDPLFGGWTAGAKKHFDDDGLYDQIFTAR